MRFCRDQLATHNQSLRLWDDMHVYTYTSTFTTTTFTLLHTGRKTLVSRSQTLSLATRD